MITEEDWVEIDRTENLFLTIDALLGWTIRFVISFSLLIALAFILKYTLIDPNSIQMLELPIEFNYEPAAKKGDREI
jgi:hypothetical protein